MPNADPESVSKWGQPFERWISEAGDNHCSHAESSYIIIGLSYSYYKHCMPIGIEFYLHSKIPVKRYTQPNNDHFASWSGWTIYVLIGPFMFWHKWSWGTTYANISDPGRPTMSSINGPLMPGPFMLWQLSTSLTRK